MEDDFLSWPRQRQRAELDHIQRLLDDTRHCLNLYDGEYRDSYDVDHSWPHTPEPISASTPYPSSERFTVRPQGPESFLTSRVGDHIPSVSQVNTLVTQTTSVFSFTRPIAVTSAVSQTQRQVSFAPPPRDTSIHELSPMEQTSVYGRISLPGVSQQSCVSEISAPRDFPHFRVDSGGVMGQEGAHQFLQENLTVPQTEFPLHDGFQGVRTQQLLGTARVRHPVHNTSQLESQSHAQAPVMGQQSLLGFRQRPGGQGIDVTASVNPVGRRHDHSSRTPQAEQYQSWQPAGQVPELRPNQLAGDHGFGNPSAGGVVRVSFGETGYSHVTNQPLLSGYGYETTASSHVGGARLPDVRDQSSPQVGHLGASQRGLIGDHGVFVGHSHPSTSAMQLPRPGVAKIGCGPPLHVSPSTSSGDLGQQSTVQASGVCMQPSCSSTGVGAMSCPHSSQSPGPQIPHSRAGVDYATGNKPKRIAGYDGKSSWSDYLAQFEIASKMNNWDSQQKAMELATSLVGQARGVLSDLSPSDRFDYSALVQKLTLRFEPGDLIGMYQSQLRGHRRKRNETIPELVQEISKLTRKAFPSADEETRNYMAVTSFITALANEKQELFVYQRDPKRIEEAGRAAMAFETFQADRQQDQANGSQTPFLRMQQGPSSSATSIPGDHLKQLLDRIERLERSQGGQQGSKRSGWNTRTGSSGVCFHCGQAGHWKRRCPNRVTTSSSSSVNVSGGQAQPLATPVSSNEVVSENTD